MQKEQQFRLRRKNRTSPEDETIASGRRSGEIGTGAVEWMDDLRSYFEAVIMREFARATESQTCGLHLRGDRTRGLLIRVRPDSYSF